MACGLELFLVWIGPWFGVVLVVDEDVVWGVLVVV